MPISPNVKATMMHDIRRDLNRARDLQDMLVVHGRYQNPGADPTPFMNVDKRDITAFIFLEAAAKFESFCYQAFLLEVRYNLDVSPQHAEFIMGNVDNGTTNLLGWGSPKKLRDRAKHLFGINGFFARLDRILGQQVYDRLCNAHVVRNRIAHSGGRASDEFRGILQPLNVPTQARQGMSVGRLLLEYPASSSRNDRWFHRFLQSYEILIDRFDTSIVIT
jgi:hypothetical protein